MKNNPLKQKRERERISVNMGNYKLGSKILKILITHQTKNVVLNFPFYPTTIYRI